jgi:nitrate reductase gamma subunit
MEIMAASIFGTALLGALGGAIIGLATYDGFFGSRADTAGLYAMGFGVLSAGLGLVLGILLLVARRLRRSQ